MFKLLHRRATAGLMALAVILSNIIVPVTPAFAAENGTYQPVWCKQTGNHWTIKQGQSGGANSWALLMTNTIRALGIDAVDTTVANGQQVMESNRSEKIDANYCAAQFTLATPTPIVTPVCGLKNDIVTVADSPNYTWVFNNNWSTHNGTTVATVTVTAASPYTFSGNAQTKIITVTELNTSTSCDVTITALPVSGVAGLCGLDNDTITVGIETSQYSKGVITQPFSGGIAKVTYTAKQGFVFSGGSKTYVETVYETNKTDCIVKDATAGIKVSVATCDANGIATIDSAKTAHATLTAPLSLVPGAHTATFTADAGHAFSDGTTSTTVAYTVPPKLTGMQCAGPQPKNDRETRIISGKPVCSPNGGGTVKSWTEERSRSYHYSEQSNSWVPGNWSDWKKVADSESTRPATTEECPGVIQVQPDCDTLGSLTLPAYKGKGDEHKGYTYIVTIGLSTTSYSADHTVTIKDIPQGAKVTVTLVSNNCFHTVISKTDYDFEYADCIAIPEAPMQNDPCGPNNATWVMPDDTDQIIWTINEDGHLIATAQGTLFTNGQSTIDFGTPTDSNTPCNVTITKSAVVANDTNKNGVIDAGDTITWTITVTNMSGNEFDNFNITVSDPNAVLENNGYIGSLGAGESATLTATSTISFDQMLICKATNTASFKAWRGERELRLASDNESVPLATGSADATYTWTCGGKGGETPTPTSTPTPTTPVATQLPHTGSQSSINYILLGLLSAVTIYGALYFAQPKKLYE